MNNDTIFCEDSRKYKKISIILSIFFFVLFICLLTIGILYITNVLPNLTDGKSFIPTSIVFLLAGIYTLWASLSKYSKQYMYVSNTDIKFCIDNIEKTFSNFDLIGFAITKKANWLMGGYWTYEIKFRNEEIYYFKSFKKDSLQIALNQVINKNVV